MILLASVVTHHTVRLKYAKSLQFPLILWIAQGEYCHPQYFMAASNMRRFAGRHYPL